MLNAASANTNVRIFFANLQGICTFFSNTPQRTAVLDETVKKRLPRSAPTRWILTPELSVLYLNTGRIL
jgi:hypothetical protein